MKNRPKKKRNMNTLVTVYALAYVTIVDAFVAIMCWVTETVPSDAWYIAHISFWGVELALNFGVYHKKKTVHMDSSGGISDSTDTEE